MTAPSPAPFASVPSFASLDEEDREFLTSLFTYRPLFEEEVLATVEPEELEEFLRAAAGEVVNNSAAKGSLNFLILDTFDRFHPAAMAPGLKKVLEDEAVYYLEETAGAGDELSESVRIDPGCQFFLAELTKEYLLHHKRAIFGVVADTFFELAAKGTSMTSVPPVVQEAINGSGKYASVLELPGGRKVATKDGQIWMRVHQAKTEKQKRVKQLAEEVKRLEKIILNLEKNADAMRKAAKFKQEALLNYRPEQLSDFVVNEEGKFTDQKRMLQFIPAGEVTMKLCENLEKSVVYARTDIQKEDMKRTLKFFNTIHGNNDPKSLKVKYKEMAEELPAKKGGLENAMRRLEEERFKTLDKYDDTLGRMKEAFIANIGKKRL